MVNNMKDLKNIEIGIILKIGYVKKWVGNLRIKWKDLYNDTKNMINIAKIFIDGKWL